MEDFAFLDETFLVDGVGEATRPFGSNQAAEAGVSQAQGGLTWNKDYVSNATWTPPMVGSQVGRIQGFTDPFENQGKFFCIIIGYSCLPLICLLIIRIL